MTHETFVKLLQGTDDDFAIACSWLVRNHDPIKYINQYGNKVVNSPVCQLSISWDKTKQWDGNYWDNNIYYKVHHKLYLIKCPWGFTATDLNYDVTARVIEH